MQDYKRCKRRWWLTWWRRLKPVREEVEGPRSLGNRVHRALYLYYRDESKESMQLAMAALADGIARDLELVGDDAELAKKVEREGELARIMMECYFQWLAETGEDAYIEIVGQEEERRVPLGYTTTTGLSIDLVDKLDTRVVDHNYEGGPARLFMDHKTVSTFADKLKTLHMDEQMKLYHLIELLILEADGAEGERTDGALYNMLRKVKRTANAKPPFYLRHPVRHNLEELRTFWQRVCGTAEAIGKTEHHLALGIDHQFVAPPTPTRDCSWDCDYFLVCPMFDDGSDAEGQLETQFEERHPMKGRYTEVWSEDEKEAT
jgi:hypothetical protein